MGENEGCTAGSRRAGRWRDDRRRAAEVIDIERRARSPRLASVGQC